MAHMQRRSWAEGAGAALSWDMKLDRTQIRGSGNSRDSYRNVISSYCNDICEDTPNKYYTFLGVRV